LAAKNVQRGLAAKVQDLSAAFRKKQRVYMESEFRASCLTSPSLVIISSIDSVMGLCLLFFCGVGSSDEPLYSSAHPELQGHAIKNQDLLIASGAISLKGSEGMSAVDDDVAAAVRLYVPRVPTDFLTRLLLIPPRHTHKCSLYPRTHLKTSLAVTVN
jgi:syntaxin 16